MQKVLFSTLNLHSTFRRIVILTIQCHNRAQSIAFFGVTINHIKLLFGENPLNIIVKDLSGDFLYFYPISVGLNQTYSTQSKTLWCTPQRYKYKFKKNCPLSVKGAPKIDYKNIKLLKRYVSENGKILPSRITNVSQKKPRELSLSIKRARNLALL